MPTRVSGYTIRIKGIRFRSRHGVSASERRLLQDFIVHVDLTLPVSALPQSDRFKDVFDYDAISRLVVEEGTTRTYRLLEMLATRLIERLLEETPALSAAVSIQKARPPTTYSVDTATVKLTGHRVVR